MLSEVLYFYLTAVLMLVCAAGVIFAPRMFLSAISLFLLILFSSLLYLSLNAFYVAGFQFILCGLCLSMYIFLLLKKIGRLNLKLKLVRPVKLISRAFFVFLFGITACLFFKEEFTNSLFDIFNFVNEKSSDVVNFSAHIFPLHLVLILVLITAVVIRVFLLSAQNSSLSEEKTTGENA